MLCILIADLIKKIALRKFPSLSTIGANIAVVENGVCCDVKAWTFML
jgi:hypothetical protein